MLTLPSRRDIFATFAASASLGLASHKDQKFPVGLVAGGRSNEQLWQSFDECKQLGVHYVEINNTHTKIVDTWESRIPEFRDEMSKRGLTLIGSAMYTHMHITQKLPELIAEHLRVARFLKAVGGRYMNPLIAPGTNLGNGTDAEYASVDIKAWAANANAIGKRVHDETGLQIGLHPEQGDIRTGQFERFMDATDPRAFNVWIDVGHFAACGFDPLAICKKYRARMIGAHLRDFKPAPQNPPPSQSGETPRGRMVAFGEGIVRLNDLIAYFVETDFKGPVLGEGAGRRAMCDYMRQALKLKL